MNTKLLVISILVVTGLVAGAYTLGVNQGSGKNVETDQQPANNKISTAGKITPDAQVPTDHASLESSLSTIQNNIDNHRKSKFTHFRVGNRNVKSIFAEADKVWVGTSGGVIRYLPESDDYRLFDVQNGLLANGIFHVSRWTEDKMLIGTYGGGLAVYDEI